VRLVVDTARIPQVLDAIARRNFMTVLNLEMMPADHYEAAQAGYFYGTAPVSTLNLTIESVWLRAWTAEFMPDELKLALGIPLRRPDTTG
jgi:hypothetical protein